MKEFLGKEIGPYKDPFIIAEISCNHTGDINEALRLIRNAYECGADAVKIQVYTPEEMTLNFRGTIDVNSDYPTEFHTNIHGPWKGKHLWDLYRQGETPIEWLPDLFSKAKQIGIPIFASVFGDKSLAALEAVECPAYKIASFELCDTGLLRKVAAKGKPILLSTGCSDYRELDRAVEATVYNLIIMHCVSKYPHTVSEAELNFIRELRREYGDPIGYSDHTHSETAALLAIASGACIIEKHYGDSDKSLDKDFSLNTKEFLHFVEQCKYASIALSPDNNKTSTSKYKRSLYVVKPISAGEEFTNDNIKSIRPNYGLPPYMLDQILGKKAKFDLMFGTALKQEMIDG